MNDHSYPVKKNWLKKIMNYDNKNIFIGTSGSFFHYSNSFYRHKNDSYLKAIIKIIFFLFSSKFSKFILEPQVF